MSLHQNLIFKNATNILVIVSKASEIFQKFYVLGKKLTPLKWLYVYNTHDYMIKNLSSYTFPCKVTRIFNNLSHKKKEENWYKANIQTFLCEMLMRIFSFFSKAQKEDNTFAADEKILLKILNPIRFQFKNAFNLQNFDFF